MSEEIKATKRKVVSQKRPIILTFIGMIIAILLILVTLDISNRNINSFVTNNQKYIIAIESVLLAIFIVEMLGRLIRAALPAHQMVAQGANLRLLVRIVGYAIALTSIVSILASNPTLGISVGAIAGVAVAFATQNILGNVIATLMIVSTRMIRVGEEITISGTKGVVSEIFLTRTALSLDEDVVFVPNSLIVSSLVRRNKRNTGKDANVHDW